MSYVDSRQLDRELAEDAAYEAGLAYEQLRERYSGRAMYGASCFGIVGSPSDAASFLVALTQLEPDSEIAFNLATAWTQDSMGLDVIVYFPGYEIVGEGEAE